MPTIDKVQMIEVQSSNLHSIGYDPKKQELYVRFQGDGPRLYLYKDVPEVVWQHFQRADSKGTFLRKIVLPYFKFRLITATSKK